MPIDMTKYLCLFVSEAQEHLEALSSDLVLLEKEKSRDIVDSMFRHAHSIKGMAASMGFAQIATIAHHVEDLVDLLRIKPEIFQASTADMLFAACDQMHSLINHVSSGHSEFDASALISRLHSHLIELTGKPPSATRVQDACVKTQSAPRDKPKHFHSPPAKAGCADSEDTPLSLPLVYSGAKVSPTVRIKTDLLDCFLDTAGELLLSSSQLRELVRALPEGQRSPLDQGLDRLRSLIKGLHEKVMSARMTPLSVLTDRFPRTVRDLARKMGRDVELVLSGTNIELDRAIVDELADPLMHLLRNAIDHGLEAPHQRVLAGKPSSGRISIAARRERERVILEIKDDGRGMDPSKLKIAAIKLGKISEAEANSLSDADALRLCCLPAVSTASSITDISGRGVGMDAVQRAVDRVGGTLAISSSRQQGTCFILELPFSVAVVNALLVGVGREIFGFPITKVKTVIEANPQSLVYKGPLPTISYRNLSIPVYFLNNLLQIERSPPTGALPYLVFDSFDSDDSNHGFVAIEVDRLLGHEETVLKPLSRPLDIIPGLAGVTILGSGRPIFILDCSRLIG